MGRDVDTDLGRIRDKKWMYEILELKIKLLKRKSSLHIKDLSKQEQDRL